MAGLSQSRREARSTRITVAVVLLGIASGVMVGALALREPFLIGAAGVFALAMGWTALRLAWNGLVFTRYEHAVDRTELAQAYRDLFAERAVEHAAFVGSMATRLAQRDTAVADLRGAVERIEMRAVEAESSARAVQGRLGSAEHQITELEAALVEPAPVTSKPPLRGGRRGDDLRQERVPEWAELEPDPVSSLMAWERHAGEVADREAGTGRHAAG